MSSSRILSTVLLLRVGHTPSFAALIDGTAGDGEIVQDSSNRPAVPARKVTLTTGVPPVLPCPLGEYRERAALAHRLLGETHRGGEGHYSTLRVYPKGVIGNSEVRRALSVPVVGARLSRLPEAPSVPDGASDEPIPGPFAVSKFEV